jgi:hypothetical protein
VAEVDAGGGVDLCSEPAGEVVEDPVEGGLAGAGEACGRDVLGSFTDFVLGVGSVRLFRRLVARLWVVGR